METYEETSVIRIMKDHVDVRGFEFPFWIAAKHDWIDTPKTIFTHERGFEFPILIAERYGFVTSEYVGDCIRKEMQEKNEEAALDSASL